MGLKVHSEIIIHVHVAHLFNYLVWELRNNWSMGYLHLFTRWPFADDISNSTSLCLSRGRGRGRGRGGRTFGEVGSHWSRAGGGGRGGLGFGGVGLRLREL